MNGPVGERTQCPVGLADIEEAAPLLEQAVVRTPMEESRWLSGVVGGPVLLKCENLQRTGSFKIRGAYLRLSRLSAAEQARGVVAASAGNHAQGVALAAQMLGIKARVYMPAGAPIVKANATRGYGAEVKLGGANLEEAMASAIAYAEETGAEYIHPYDHADVITGQGTCGLEVAAQAPDAATVVIPLGGGGLTAGMAIALKGLRPDLRVVAVQAQGAAAYPASLEAGAPVPLSTMHTMADGIAVGRPGDLTFAAIRDHVDEVVTVTEDSISRALVLLLERAKLVVEPSGAVAVAAVLDRPERFATPAVAVLSGGNVDPLLLGKLIRHGMSAGGRYLRLRVSRVPDRPGGLARLLAELADAGANVLEVVHERIAASLRPDEVEVLLQLETRGPEHAEDVVRRLREHGYRVME